MMVPAARLLLLLLLLMGSQGQVFQVKYQEGQTLRVNCSYKPQKTENRWKTWCKLTEDEKVCDRLITSKSDFLMLPLMDTRASLKDDTSTGTIIIFMSNLTVEDSGNYCCGIYDPINSIIVNIRTVRLEVAPGFDGSSSSASWKATTLKTTKCSRSTTETRLTIPLATSRPPHSSIFFNCPGIQVLYGLIVAKGFVFTILLVFLARCRGPGKGSS